MTHERLAIKAYTTVSAIGRGQADTLAALRAGRSGLQEATLPGGDAKTYVGPVAGLDDVRLPQEFSAFDCRNARLAELALTTDAFADHVAKAKDQFGAQRIAVVLGTSTSGVSAGEKAYANQDDQGRLPAGFDFAHTQELGALAQYVRARLGLDGVAYTISTACSSATKSFVDGAQLIRTGLADAVVVGGVDTLCETSLRGFHALELLSAEPCRPNDESSRGISIGEAGGFALLARAEDDDRLMILGSGESTDAYHMSSPHPEGLGATIAMRAALDSAGVSAEAIDYVNLHGTGSAANDRVEDKAVTDVLGTSVPVSSTKGWTGHTLGAAGIVDSAICFLALEHGLIPANLNMVTKNPAFTSAIVETNRDRELATVLTNNFGFGGNNCTLIFARSVGRRA